MIQLIPKQRKGNESFQNNVVSPLVSANHSIMPTVQPSPAPEVGQINQEWT